MTPPTDEVLAGLLRGEAQLQQRHLWMLAALPPSGMTVTDCAHVMQVGIPWASRTSTLLVELGYLKRVVPPEDRRAFYLVPTATGLALAARITAVSRSKHVRQHAAA